MKRAFVYGPFDLRVDEVEEPEPGPGEVRVRIVTSGPYGTDLKYYRGEIPGLQYPVSFGGESAGVIDKVGPGVTDRFVGQRVTPMYFPHCGVCDFCVAGNTNLCTNFPNLAAEKKHLASFTEKLISTVKRALPLPDGATFDDGAMTGSVGCAVAIKNKLKYVVGDTVLVIGAGPTGIPNIQLAHAAGCKVIVFEHRELRRDMAKKSGAFAAIDPRTVDPAQFLKETCGKGPNHVIETSGSASSTRASVQFAGWGAKVALMGSGVYDFSAFEVMHKGLQVFGIRGMTEAERRETVSLLGSGIFNLGIQITHRFPLTEIAKAFEIMHDRSIDQGRVMLDHTSP